MSDDPALVWTSAVELTIEVDAAANAWHAGHVNDVLTLADGGGSVGIAVATDTGGVWLVPRAGGGIPLSETWDTPDVRCLAGGPDHSRHLYAGGGRLNRLTTPSIVSWGPGRLDAFAIGRDGALWHSWGDGATWAPWESLGGEIVSPPVVTSWGANRLDVFVVGTDRALYHKAWNGSQWLPSVGGWTPLGGDVVGTPTAVSWGPNRCDVFAVHPDRGLRHLYGDGASFSGWEPLSSLVIGAPSVVSWGVNRLDVFVTGIDFKIYHKAWDGSGWLPTDGWHPLGGDRLGSPTAVSWGPDRLDVFAVDTNQNSWHLWGDGATFSGWEPLGGAFVGQLAAVSTAPERLDVFAVATGGRSYHKAWNGSKWLPSQLTWDSLAGVIQGSVTAAVSGGRLNIMGLGNDGVAYHAGWAASASPPGTWIPLPPPWVGALHETDNSAPSPILRWRDIPLAAGGLVYDIAVLAKERRIVLATGDGVWWAPLPKAPTSTGVYAWKRALNLPPGAYSGIALGPGSTVVVGAEGADVQSGHYGLFWGAWVQGELSMTRSAITGVDARQMQPTVVASCDTNRNTMYAATGGPGDQLLAVLRSADGGKNWTACGLKVDGDAKGNTLPFFTGQFSRYNNAIDVSPIDPKTVALGWRNGPYVSTNSGTSWSPKGMGWAGTAWAFTSPHLHSDVHAVLFDRTDPTGKRFYVGSDGGVALTPDLGATFSTEDNMQLNCLQHQSWPGNAWAGSSAASTKTPGLVGSGMQDNGVIYAQSGVGGSRWRKLAAGDGQFAQFVASGQMLWTSNGSLALRPASWDGTHLKAAGVIPITATKTGPANPAGIGVPANGRMPVVGVPLPSAKNAAGQLMSAIAAEGSDLYGLYAAADGSGMHWEYLTSVSTIFGESVTALGTRDGRTILVGTSKGRVFGHDRSTGFTLEHAVTARPAAQGTIYHFVVKSAGRAFAVLNTGANGYLLRFDGTEWRPVAGLPTETIFGLAGGLNDKNLYVSTDSRVWMSRDDGATWRRASQGLPRRPHCGDLSLVATGTKQTLYLGTYGRSLWRTPVGA